MADQIPRYAATPLERFLRYIKQSSRLLHMSISGISMQMLLPKTVEVLAKTDHTKRTPEQDQERKRQFEQELKDAKSRAAFAKDELDNGFPMLHEQALVGMCGAFEAALEDCLVGILVNEPQLLGREVFAKVKVSLAEFETLEKEERMRLLLAEVCRGQGVGVRQGVDPYETLLASVDLSGAVDTEVKKTIWEMLHVRNVIVHRGGFADRRLVNGCPWKNIKVGDKVKVTHELLGNYEHSLGEYLLTIIRRLCSKYDVDFDEKVRTGLMELEEESAAAGSS